MQVADKISGFESHKPVLLDWFRSMLKYPVLGSWQTSGDRFPMMNRLFSYDCVNLENICLWVHQRSFAFPKTQVVSESHVANLELKVSINLRQEFWSWWSDDTNDRSQETSTWIDTHIQSRYHQKYLCALPTMRPIFSVLVVAGLFSQTVFADPTFIFNL